ncbi:MAG TPA: 4-hydroxy-tetrahydrodipicolinate reductase [Tissierellales bacterium]|nr:4-hydroxy-tetrahydrodipicolinate reductase [Tissierellales bacterium]
MLKVGINGYLGAMGQVIAKEIKENKEMSLVVGIDKKAIENDKNNIKVYDNISDIKEELDVIIDFSHPSSLEPILKFASENNIALVIGTTGLENEHIEKIKAASDKIAIFYSANMSLGVNLLLSLVKKSANLLGDSFDIEIIEKHHNKKIDAPSGTAYMIADSINETLNNSKNYVYNRHDKSLKREKNEIGIHSIRGGTVVGEHTAIFAGPDEVIEITHSAASKKIFAQGALKAAKFIINKDNGLFNMDDLINN